ncbi:heavy metal translocating P-type ATPase [Bacillus taeanensis]|uniref:Cd(2+)-exporting ATPase n=1 Tax=Bacillus taeanensis TaxID=273032 RepID=A0A366XVH3_9BACI|nr:cation-translocating P-type ATPase [Bacillus taeanensis]RBW68759.1 heavy metal translocating P-type ATPase [Bacillus taeanensis]
MVSFEVLHSLPGRTRLRLSPTNLPSYQIEYYFRTFPFITSALYSEVTRSLLLYHDDALTSSDLLFLLSKQKQENEKTPQQSEQLSTKHEMITVGIASASLLLDVVLKSSPLFVSRFGIAAQLPTLLALFASREIFKNGIKSLIAEHKPNADTLSAAAIAASLLKNSPRSAMMIQIMSSISELLTQYTMYRTRRYVRDMLALDAPCAWLVNEDGNETKVVVDSLKPGDVIAVFEGEKVSVDGTIINGYGTLDESPITGEYLPKEAGIGAPAFAGSVLQSGMLVMKVEKVGDATALNRIIHLIEEAQTKQAPIQMYADRTAEKLVPVSFAIAGLIYLTTRSWDRVLNMLVIDFVCGIKLSTAAAISASIGKAAQKGMLIKGGHYLEKLSKVDTLILDKTGTITEGRPIVKDVIAYGDFSKEDVIRYAASAEEHSSHPIAHAIIKQAEKWKVDVPEHDHESIEMVVGRGIRAVVEKQVLLVGNMAYMKEEGVQLPVMEELENKLNKQGNSVYVACNSSLIGVITVEDKIRPGMNRAIYQMRRAGVDEVLMLTGDKEEAAKSLMRSLSIDSYKAEVLPEEKAEFVRAFREKNNTVMMVGEGINDAPALAYADIGLTIGAKRTDIAVEASDVIISSDDPLMLPEVVRLSKRTMKTIQRNFAATILINSAAILLGALGIISPVVGAGIHNAATIGVVANSAKILWMKES